LVSEDQPKISLLDPTRLVRILKKNPNPAGMLKSRYPPITG
jgi:hypothetical protein